MPYIKIQVTDEGVTSSQKKQLISQVTDAVVTTLNKRPESTFVVIDEVNTDNWGVAGKQVTDIIKNNAQ